ncbi:MAG: hypothetical protein HYT22_03240 [Candidatus Niyogibacteria bacterium]|nr:hypothetical protein [Candidatus Niyogibacteria bacterium]
MHPILEQHKKSGSFANAYIVLDATPDAISEFLKSEGVVESYAGGALSAPDSLARRGGIDSVRDIRGKAHLARQGRLFFVLDADTFNWQSYPALLKLIEEPPSGCHFFFAASAIESVPETIRSRAIVVRTQQPNELSERIRPPTDLVKSRAFDTLGGWELNGKARAQWIESCAENEEQFLKFLDDYEQWARFRPNAAALLSRAYEVRSSEHVLNLGRKMCLEYLISFKG